MHLLWSAFYCARRHIHFMMVINVLRNANLGMQLRMLYRCVPRNAILHWFTSSTFSTVVSLIFVSPPVRWVNSCEGAIINVYKIVPIRI